MATRACCRIIGGCSDFVKILTLSSDRVGARLDLVDVVIGVCESGVQALVGGRLPIVGFVVGVDQLRRRQWWCPGRTVRK